MKFHATRLGTFGTSLPTDREGYVTCSPERVRRARAGLRVSKRRSDLVNLYGSTNVLVAEAEEALEAWRQ